MAKTSAVEKNKRRRNTVANQAGKRAALKAIIMNQSLSIEERFKATLKLASLPRDGSKTRIRNRCGIDIHDLGAGLAAHRRALHGVCGRWRSPRKRRG